MGQPVKDVRIRRSEVRETSDVRVSRSKNRTAPDDVRAMEIDGDESTEDVKSDMYGVDMEIRLDLAVAEVIRQRLPELSCLRLE